MAIYQELVFKHIPVFSIDMHAGRQLHKHNFMHGRPLDHVDESTYIGGQTTKIFVSGIIYLMMQWQTFFLKEVHPVDSNLPLEVIFTGEQARDFEGPQREFLSNMLRLI